MNARKLVKQATVDALTAAAADPESPLAGIHISTGREPDNKKEWVWIYRAKGKREYKVLGPRPAPNEEDIAVMVRIVAIRGNSDAAEARAEALADAAEGALRNVAVGAPVLLPLLVAEVEDEPLDFDARAGHHYLLTVSTKARI